MMNWEIAAANWKRFEETHAVDVGLFKFIGKSWAERHEVKFKKEMPPHQEVSYISARLVPWFS